LKAWKKSDYIAIVFLVAAFFLSLKINCIKSWFKNNMQQNLKLNAQSALAIFDSGCF